MPDRRATGFTPSTIKSCFALLFLQEPRALLSVQNKSLASDRVAIKRTPGSHLAYCEHKQQMARGCMSSEPFGQVSNRFKRGSGPSELKLWLRVHDAAGVVAGWF